MICIWIHEKRRRRIIACKPFNINHLLVKALFLNLISVSMACIRQSLLNSGIPCNSILKNAVLCKRRDLLCVSVITPQSIILPARNFKSSLQIQSAKPRIPVINVKGGGSRPYTPRRALM